MPRSNPTTESRTARLTILVDPRKKRIFEEICAAQDLTPSQVVRRLIRQYIIEHAAGRPLPEWLTVQGKKNENADEQKAFASSGR
jgi:antitoxin component of RelBE/YafQ-DinJ toxin-antitoxin module